MNPYLSLQNALQNDPQCWLVSGGAGFIGSHLVEKLLLLEQRVRVLDNHFSSTSSNLEQVAQAVGPDLAERLELIVGDIRDGQTCERAMRGVDTVVHLAALGSVPLSLEEPKLCHEINVTGTLNMMLATRGAGVKRFVYASSSAVYGDDSLPMKVERSLGRPLSPYAASKSQCEIYGTTLHLAYGLETVGLRFFNVYGPRQNPMGAYAAVVPSWIHAMTRDEPVYINGDGCNTRDFCFVKDVVQGLLLASRTDKTEAFGKAFNVGLGRATDLNGLFETIRRLVQKNSQKIVPDVIYRDFRAGDILHSCADISRVRDVLDFLPDFTTESGLEETITSMSAWELRQ